MKLRIPKYSKLARTRAHELREQARREKQPVKPIDYAPFYPQILRSPDSKVRGRRVDEFLYLPGDVVQLVRGPDKGVITKVQHVFPDRSALVLANAGPSTEMVVPRRFWMQGQKQYVIPVPEAVHHDDVRLITTVADATGALRKAAVQELRLGGEYWDDRHKKVMRHRIVAHSDVSIPWPAPEEPVPDGTMAVDPDLARERTFFVTSLRIPPIPLAALDSLRLKYSRFRKPDLTEQQLEMLTPPEMPRSDAKLAYKAEVELYKQQRRDRDLSGKTQEILLQSAAVLEKLMASKQARSESS